MSPPPAPPLPGPRRRRPAPGWLLAVVALAVLLIAATAPAVSAQTIVDDMLYVWEDTSTSTEPYGQGGGSKTFAYDRLYLTNIENRQNIGYVGFVFLGNSIAGTSLVEGQNDLMYTFNGQTNPCRIYITHQKNFLGTITSTQTLIFFDDWDIGALSGEQRVTFSKAVMTAPSVRKQDGGAGTPNAYWEKPDTSKYYPTNIQSVTVASYVESQNRLVVESENGVYTISLTREYPPSSYASRFEAIKSDVVVFYNEDTNDLETAYLTNQIDTINVILASKTFTYPLNSGGGAVDADVTVYVRNSQTGALLANADLTIQDTTTDPWTEVVNETLSSGTGTFSLPIDAGLHLTQYRIGATVPGYQQVVPALFARVTGPTNIVVEMEPTAGGPEDPNNAYIEFYVRDIHANGIPNANVLVDGKTRWTNGQGYTQFEVAKNGTYPYTVSKSGYMTIQGSAIVLDGPRYVANVVLGPGTVPTNPPTIGPGETPGGPGATPTPDTRTNEQKGQAIIDLIADFAEPIAILAILATIFGLMKMMTPGRR